MDVNLPADHERADGLSDRARRLRQAIDKVRLEDRELLERLGK